MRVVLGSATAGVLILLASGCSNLTKMQKAPEMNPLLADLVDYRNGLKMLREGRADEAIALLRRARSTSPLDPNVPNALGLALLYKRDFTAATKAFNDAIKLDEKFYESFNNRGVTWMEAGKLDQAEEDFRVVIESDLPPSARDRLNARYNLGMVNIKRSQFADAERELSLVIVDDPQYVAAYRQRGLARMKRDNFREALEDFLRVLRDVPKDPPANYHAALCLLTTGRRDVALRYMERAAMAAPESEDGKRAKRFLDQESVLPALLPPPGSGDGQ